MRVITSFVSQALLQLDLHVEAYDGFVFDNEHSIHIGFARSPSAFLKIRGGWGRANTYYGTDRSSLFRAISSNN